MFTWDFVILGFVLWFHSLPVAVHVTLVGLKHTDYYTGDSNLKYCTRIRLLAIWVSRRPVDGHFLKNIVLFFICCLINCSFEQAL